MFLGFQREKYAFGEYTETFSYTLLEVKDGLFLPGLPPLPLLRKVSAFAFFPLIFRCSAFSRFSA